MMMPLSAALVAAHLDSAPLRCACSAFLPHYEATSVVARSNQDQPSSVAREANPLEAHLANVRQLTFGGQNAEAYWDPSGEWITYQSRQPGYPDEQIFTMRADGSEKALISTGLGRCTCSYFDPNGEYVYFSSTHERNEGPQAKIDMSKGYVWMVNPQFGLYRARRDGTGIQPVIVRRGYVAETTISPDRSYMVFTGGFDGDLDIYKANVDGTGITRLTDAYGYDGGPFVSWDGTKIVYRRATIANEQERADYKALLKQNLIRPGKLEIWIMDADGKNKRQITRLGVASFAPFLLPDGKRIIFSSNYGDPKGREFDLYMIRTDGTGLKRITHTPEFDGFPMVTRDGKKLVWASNRFGKERGETNIFVADWKD